MSKTSNAEFIRWPLAAIVFVFAMLVGGCATSPRTQLDWPGYDTSLPQKTASSAPVKHHAVRSEPVRVARETQPTPKKKPKPVDVARNDTPVVTSGSGNFIWPVKGKVIARFGSTDEGERNDGINIAASAGEPIRAADSGTVTYAGNELRNYGNLVLIRHDNGYITAYAHAQSISVNKGDRVLKGQVIGYAGATGDVSRPQVHFEIRRGVEPINPQPLLVAYASAAS